MKPFFKYNSQDFINIMSISKASASTVDGSLTLILTQHNGQMIELKDMIAEKFLNEYSNDMYIHNGN